MQVLKMAMHATVEMLITSLSQLTLESVAFHALVMLVNSVAAHGVYKYMIPESSMLKLKLQRLNLNQKQLCHQQPMPF